MTRDSDLVQFSNGVVVKYVAGSTRRRSSQRWTTT